MVFTSADTKKRLKINVEIINTLRDSGEWMSASEIANCIRGRTDSHGVGRRLLYLSDEYPIESYMTRSKPNTRMYRYVRGESA